MSAAKSRRISSRPLIEGRTKHISTQFSGYTPLVDGPDRIQPGKHRDSSPTLSNTRDQSASTRCWNPIWLHAGTLVACMVTFVCLSVALIGLYIQSMKQAGLRTQGVHQILWTYGPTAVFIFIASIWMRIDHWCKVLTPFERMRDRTTSAHQSMLQDYLSPWIPTTLVNSVRSRDVVVIMTTLGTVFLRLSIVLSSSLLVLESQIVSSSSDTLLAQEFSSIMPDLAVNVQEYGNGAGLSDEVGLRYYGMLSGRLPPSPTASSNLTIENFFSNNTTPGNLTYTATVAGISATLDCEPLNPSNATYETRLDAQYDLPAFAVNITTPNCTIIGVPMGCGLYTGNNQTTNSTNSYQGWWGNFTCNDGVVNNRYHLFGSSGRPVHPGFDDKRMVFIASNVQWTPAGPKNVNIERKTWVESFTGVVCKPSYSVDDYTVTYSSDTRGTNLPFDAVRQPGTSRDMTNLSNDDLPLIMHQVLTQANLVHRTREVNTTSAGNVIDKANVDEDDKFFSLMSAIEGSGELSSLLDQSKLLRLVPIAFSGLMAQAFETHLLVPANRSVRMQSRVIEDRLVLKETPCVAIISFMSLMVLTTTVVFFKRPRHVVPLNPQSISSKAKLLASSKDLHKTLCALNAARLEGMVESLSSLSYGSSICTTRQGVSLAIEPQVTACTPTPTQTNQIDKFAWWRPLTSELWFMIAISASSVAIIVVLEILQHVSDTNDGVCDLDYWSSNHAVATIVPTALMSGIVLMYATLSFNINIAAPFIALKQNPITYRRGLDVSLIDRPSLLSLYLAAKNYLVAPAFASTALTVGVLLPIIVSGLYQVAHTSLMIPALVRPTDTFRYDPQTLYQGSDGFASVITMLLYNENSTYPDGTWHTLALPHIDVEHDLNRNLSSGIVSAQLLAARPSLVCTQVLSSSLRHSQSGRTTTLSTLQINADIELPCTENIDGSGLVGNCTVTQSVTVKVPEEFPGSIVSGLNSSQNACGCSAPLSIASINASQTYHPTGGCPSVTYAYGTLVNPTTEDKVDVSSMLDSISFLYCYQAIEEVQVEAQFALPSLRLEQNSVPRVFEETATIVNITSANYTGPSYCNTIGSLVEAVSGRLQNDETGSLFQTIFNGRPQYKPTDFLGEAGVPALKTAVNELYATYMAQVISANFRSNVSALETPREHNATITFSNVLRLKQTASIKIALQVMVGIMLVCAVAVFAMTNRHAILPYNPCSIAGTMVLLAGSELTRHARALGSSTRSPTTSRANNSDDLLWSGYLFSLGWWGTQESPRYGIDIGRAERSRWDLPTDTTVPVQQTMKGRNQKSSSSIQFQPEVRVYEVSLLTESYAYDGNGEGRVSRDISEISRDYDHDDFEY